MFSGVANSTNFDDTEEGELRSSPPKEESANVSSYTLKGTEVHIDDGVMIDRTESINFLPAEPMESSESASSANESDWSNNLRRSLLNGNDFITAVDDDEETKSKRQKLSACFNCGGDHQLNNCPEPKDQQRIRKAAAEFKEKKRLSEAARYHQEDTPSKSTEFRPGRISNNLRKALGIGPDDIPEWIYRMRKMGFIKGYPPGYLRQAVEQEEREDEVLKFHLVDDEVNQNNAGETDRESPPPVLNEKKMFYYMGFNMTYRKLNDKEANFRIPPFDKFCQFIQDDLRDKYWKTRTERKTKREQDKKRKRVTARELQQEGDIVILDSQNADDDVLSCITIDRNPTSEDPAEPPLEPTNNTEIKDIPLDQSTSSEPSSSNNGDASMATIVMPGTPIVLRRNGSTGPAQPVLPTLDAFSKGITPFKALEEPTPHRGFMKRIFEKIRSVTGK